MPDSRAPGARLAVGNSSRGYCLDVDAAGGAKKIQGVGFHACAFRLSNCERCVVENVTVEYGSMPREITPRNPTTGAPPPIPSVSGNRSTLSRLRVMHAAGGGLAIHGSHNVLDEALIEDVDWLGTLDFSPLAVGFGSETPTVRSIEIARHGSAPYGVNNSVHRITMRRVGNAGVVMSELSNSVSYSHIHTVGLIATDLAAIHVDHNGAGPMCATLPNMDKHCKKVYHHNWIHDCSELGIRGDDDNRNLDLHHNVIFNVSGAAIMFKGDHNRAAHNTIFGVSNGRFDFASDFFIVTAPCDTNSHKGEGNCSQGNARSSFSNSVYGGLNGSSARGTARQNWEFSGGAGHCTGPASLGGTCAFERWEGMLNVSMHEDLELVDTHNFDFRPSASSLLRQRGVPRGIDVGAPPHDSDLQKLFVEPEKNLLL
jgi:hypothetical protein